MAEKQTIETKTATISVDQHGIVHFATKPSTSISLDDAKQNIEAITSLSPHEKVYNIANLKNMIGMSSEARSYVSEFADEHYAAVAITADSLVAKAIAQLFLTINKPKVPTKVFGSYKGGVNWLKEQMPTT